MSRLSRRELLAALGATGLAAAAHAQDAGEAPAPTPKGDLVTPKGVPATLVDGKVIQPQRELPVLRKTDVLVVGGGPAGVAAAIAARRVGADVTIVERYGHFGGQWTGGLVLIVIGMHVKGGKHVTKGIGYEIMQRLEKLDRGIVNTRPGASPTVDAEALKYMMVEMIREAGVNVFLHCWGVDAIWGTSGPPPQAMWTWQPRSLSSRARRRTLWQMLSSQRPGATKSAFLTRGSPASPGRGGRPLPTRKTVLTWPSLSGWASRRRPVRCR